MTEAKKETQAPIYTSRKFIIGMITIAITVLAPFVGSKMGWSESMTNQIILVVLGIGGSLIGAHAFTDASITKAKLALEDGRAARAATETSREQSLSMIETLSPMVSQLLSVIQSVRKSNATPAVPDAEENEDAARAIWEYVTGTERKAVGISEDEEGTVIAYGAPFAPGADPSVTTTVTTTVSSEVKAPDDEEIG